MLFRSYQPVQDADNLSGLTYDWIIPDDIDNQVKVRVSNTDITEPTIVGVSGLFSIKGKLQITNPASGVVWDVAQQKDITWITTGSIATVRLEYDYGSGLNPITASVNASNQIYQWTIPNTIGDNVTVKITDNLDNTVTHTSNVFKIAADINLLSPMGTEVWIVDNSEPITWEKFGDIVNVVLKYDTNEGLNGYPNTIATRPAVDGSYSWPVPDVIGDKLRVRIEDANASSSTQPDESPANFEIQGSITITSPALNDIWLCETQHDIAYTIHGSIANVSIEYSTDAGVTYPYAPIAGSVAVGPGDYTQTWTIPLDTSIQTVIKIINLADANVYDESNEFSMRGGFTFVHPVSTDRWLANSTNMISWNTLGAISSVYVEYSLNNGGVWGYVNDGSAISNATDRKSVV